MVKYKVYSDTEDLLHKFPLLKICSIHMNRDVSVAWPYISVSPIQMNWIDSNICATNLLHVNVLLLFISHLLYIC